MLSERQRYKGILESSTYLGGFLHIPLPEPSASMCSNLHNLALETAIGTAPGLAIATRHLFPNPRDGFGPVGLIGRSSDGIQADGRRSGTRRGEGHAIGEVYVRLKVLRKRVFAKPNRGCSQSKLDCFNYWQRPR